jgi:hypothetical protein
MPTDVADEVLKHGGRLNAGRSALCRETQAHTLPAGPIETIKPSRSSKLEPFQKQLVVLNFWEPGSQGFCECALPGFNPPIPATGRCTGGTVQKSTVFGPRLPLCVNFAPRIEDLRKDGHRSETSECLPHFLGGP